MKTVNFFIILVCAMLLISPISGCGDEEELKPETREETPPQAVEKQREIPPQTVEKEKEIPAPEEAVKTPEPVAPMPTQVARQTASEIIDEIIIDNKGYAQDKKGPVKFSHGRHFKEYNVECAQCHHQYENGKNVWKPGDIVKKCVVCHNQIEEQGGILKLDRAYHDNCRSCHSEVSKEGKEAPYRKCSSCHEQ